MNRKEYIRQLAKQIADEVIQSNQPLINRIVTAEVDKIKAQLASLAPNAADRRRMLAVMGSNSALGVYLAKTDELAGFKSDIATTPNRAPTAQEYWGENLDDFTRQYWDGDDETNKRISEYFDAPNEISGINLDDFFGPDVYSVSKD
ncbi:hypothetical protein M4A21_000944 [Escherichia coli]|nr:hypothetical protein [Escherichia coli]